MGMFHFTFFFAQVILAYLYVRNKGAIRLPAAYLYHLSTILFLNPPKKKFPMRNLASDILSPHEESNRIFLCPTFVTRRKPSFSTSLSSLKHTIFLILLTKHDAIDIVDPRNMQDACHI